MDNNIYSSDIQDIADLSGFVADTNDSIIKVIGVGGGGGNAVNYMYKQQIPYVNFVVCNTDQQALKLSPVPTQLLIGKDITKGLGAGNIPEVGRQCAEADADKIRELFNDKTEMVFITAGMGGGTGTGAAPVVAQIAKDCGMLTIGIVTVPFFFEGEKKILKAIEGAQEMKKYVDALLVINNENLIELYKDLDFFNAFCKADDTLANAARSISEIISEPMYINVDFQDVKTTLKDSGTAIISTAIGEGPHRISDAIHNALHSPLLKAHDINTSKRLLLKFVCSRNAEHPIRAEEIAEITQFTAKLPASIDVKWGIGDDPAMGDRVKITVLASGFDVTLRDSDKITGDRPIPDKSSSPRTQSDGGIIMLDSEEKDNGEIAHEETVKQKDVQNAMAEVYGHDKIKEHIRASDELKYVVLKPSQFDEFEIIALLEKVPTFNRAPGFKEQIENAGNPASSRVQPRQPQRDEDRGANTITF